jgi:hypothetical protein
MPIRLAVVFSLGVVAVPAGLGAVIVLHPTGSGWIVETLVVVSAAALLGGAVAGFAIGRGGVLAGYLVMLAGLAVVVGALALLGHQAGSLFWWAGVIMSVGFAVGRGLSWVVRPARASTDEPPGAPAAGAPDRGGFWDGTRWR